MKKHNKFLRSLIAVILAIVMVGTIVPTTVFAADVDAPVTEDFTGDATEDVLGGISFDGLIEAAKKLIEQFKALVEKIMNIVKGMLGSEEDPTVPTEELVPDVRWYYETEASKEYTLTTGAELAGLAYLVNEGNSFAGVTIYLGNDIDLGNADWTPIGNELGRSFNGTFDGQGYTVSNLNVTAKAGAALIGFARGGVNGGIKNVTVENVYATGNDYVAGVVGQLYTTIENCHVYTATIVAVPFRMENGEYDGGAKAGGVVGWMEEGSIYTASGCTATGVSVRAYRDLGGTIGMAHNNNVITNCGATDCTLEYYYLSADRVYTEGKVNENMGEVIGRRGANVVETGTHFYNVILNK